MTFPASPTKVQQFVQSAETRANQLKALALNWKPIAEADHSAEDLITNWLPVIRSAMENEFRPSTNLAAGFKSAVSTYVATRLESPPADWWAEYDAVRAALVVVRNRMVSEVPATWGTVDAGGVVTWVTVAGNAVLGNGLQSLANTIA